MKKALITYEVIQNDKGTLFLKKDGFITPVRNCIDNLSLISCLEVDLEFAIKEREKDEPKHDLDG